MAYTLPVFNVPVDVWSTGNLPASEVPDFENVTSQFYIYSRVSFDINACELELYSPPIQIRMPLAAIVPWTQGQVFEVPAESGRYYRARLKERVHMGFVNEYLVIYVVQCNANGKPLNRDIEGAIPCGGAGGEIALTVGTAVHSLFHNSAFAPFDHVFFGISFSLGFTQRIIMDVSGSFLKNAAGGDHVFSGMLSMTIRDDGVGVWIWVHPIPP